MQDLFEFLLTDKTEISGIEVEELGKRIDLLSRIISEERANEHEHGSDIGKVEYLQDVLHLYPPEGSVFFFSTPTIKFSGPLEISPFIESHNKRSYLGIYISVQGNNYSLHRANVVPLRL